LVVSVVPLTAPVANEPDTKPLLKPTSPPTPDPNGESWPVAPLTAPEAPEFVMLPPKSFWPTSPPTKLVKPPETVPDANDPLIDPGLKPTRPPA
jgi:hypothetical protein